MIHGYKIVAPISRGFYGAAYRASQGALGRIVVIKVVPVALYSLFNKSWEEECREHAALAEATPFVAQITDQFTEKVRFGLDELDCHVAVLENINGPTLAEVLADPQGQNLTSRMSAQIASDLFSIYELFTTSKRFHNDLHAANVLIRKLGPQNARAGAIEPKICTVAIDLGSVLDASKSGGARIGDQHQIAVHLMHLARALRSVPGAKDVDNRIAGALAGLAEHLSGRPGMQRVMTVTDAQSALSAAMSAAHEPWRRPLSLHRFGDAYNAQALESWHVPELWFDPEGRWLKATTVRGPQVITGMRGCGKTMLLRAIHFHARAVQATAASTPETLDSALGADEFIGVYASCQKLLDPREGAGPPGPVRRPFERLFVAYLKDGLQVLRHLRSLSTHSVPAALDEQLKRALPMLDLPPNTGPGEGEAGFERFLADLHFGLSDGSIDCRLRGAPADVFGELADVLRTAAPALSSKYVLFLLDDVSTRYLPPEVVRDVISQLLFQHPRCAFRITTEAQALQRVLLSPGGSAAADPSRDYQEFDLGNEVYRLLKEGSVTDRSDFVAEILRRRGKQFPEPLYRLEPKSLLGDVPLNEIAREIAASSATSAARKRVYRGLRALQAVCVGDLGDVVKLYERILDKASPSELPVPPGVQCDCFLEHSAGLLHFLNRRDQKKKNLALAFAQASGELLKQSHTATGESSHGLRQYTKLYVRVDPGDEETANEIFELLDAGVFVYDGGRARTKTRDDDPVLQFKLSFRKMLGLASFIGLSARDRFELSGKTLRDWLREPAKAKKILTDSVAKAVLSTAEPSADVDGIEADVVAPPSGPAPQLPLLTPLVGNSAEKREILAPSLGLHAAEFALDTWKEQIDTAVFALGFEERTIASVERVLAAVKPRRALLVRYSSDQGEQVADLISRAGIESVEVPTLDALRSELGSRPKERLLIDSSGLSKPFLFEAVRCGLSSSRRIVVVHTLATEHYPRNEDLEKRGVSAKERLSGAAFAQLGELLVGEQGPYTMVRVHENPAEPDRWRTLLASVSPKNDRLHHLLDKRNYEAVRILAPPPGTARRNLARAAAELLSSEAGANVGLINVETNDLLQAIRVLEQIYGDHYFFSGGNVELGLTGSKMHAVACAALAAAARISAVWYVSPAKYDRERFTRGVEATHSFEVTWQPPIAEETHE
jgi:hypothetical protein